MVDCDAVAKAASKMPFVTVARSYKYMCSTPGQEMIVQDIKDLGLDPAKVNPQGGAIALGHPLGATGTVRAATLLHGMRRDKLKYGMVTMCIGTGMGAAGVFEALA
jgi:hypothetical protein